MRIHRDGQLALGDLSGAVVVAQLEGRLVRVRDRGTFRVGVGARVRVGVEASLHLPLTLSLSLSLSLSLTLKRLPRSTRATRGCLVRVRVRARLFG